MSGENTPKEEKKVNYQYLVDSISIDLIISPFFDKSEILQKIKNIANKTYEYPINIFYRNDFNIVIDNMYKEIGIVEPIKENKT